MVSVFVVVLWSSGVRFYSKNFQSSLDVFFAQVCGGKGRLCRLVPCLQSLGVKNGSGAVPEAASLSLAAESFG